MSEPKSLHNPETASDPAATEAGTRGQSPVEDSKVEDPDIVDWDGPDDGANPHNWTASKRWTHIILVSLFALVTNMAPTMCVPGIPQLTHDFGVTSDTLQTLAVTIYVLGLAIGPMLISPLSETYGRLPIYHATNLVFVAFVVGNALSQDIAQFMVFRFISGCAGGTPMALGGATIADVTSPAQRSIAMALFSLGPLTGPVLGPVIGGFTAGGLNWRWTFWLLAILGATVSVVAVVLMRETHPKTLLERKTARLRDSTGNQDLRSIMGVTSRLTPNQILGAALVRPTRLLLRSPILLVISIYVALIFGTMYLLFTTFTDVFEVQYGFSTSVSGLSYLGLGAALIVALVTFRTVGDRIQVSRMRADGVKTPKAEYRLVLMMWFSVFIPIGLFIYGWTAFYQVHWIVPIIGTAFIGFGAFFVLMPAQLYLVDVFGSQAAASALSANNLLRFLFSTFLPLAGPALYKSLGYGWGNSLMGFLALAFVPAPIFFYKYGERLRANFVMNF